MQKVLYRFSLLLLFSAMLSGCSSIGQKSASMSVVYAVAAIFSLLLLVLYCSIGKKRDPWYVLLFTSIMVVNIGYFALAISEELGEALLANRVSYLGSVFLPLSMWMIILKATHISYRKWMPGVLLFLAAIIFLIAASPGYLPIYYKEVSFQKVNGVATLAKDYGPLHILYLIYLLGYFAAMVVTIIHATLKDKIDSPAYAVIIAIAVFVNLGVWMIEQLVYITFEFLSVSYIISECFLLGLHFLMEEEKKQRLHNQQQPSAPEVASSAKAKAIPPAENNSEAINHFLSGLSGLTPKERELYECYIAGMTTDVIMEKLAIKENTLKFHSKNLYGKLGVKSRKHLMELYKQIS